MQPRNTEAVIGYGGTDTDAKDAILARSEQLRAKKCSEGVAIAISKQSFLPLKHLEVPIDGVKSVRKTLKMHGVGLVGEG